MTDDASDLEEALDGLIAAGRYAEAIGEHDIDRDIGRLYQRLAKASPDEHWEQPDTDVDWLDDLEDPTLTLDERLRERARESDDLHVVEDDESTLVGEDEETVMVTESVRDEMLPDRVDTNFLDDNEAYYPVPTDWEDAEKPCPECGHPFEGGREYGWIKDKCVGDMFGGNAYYDCPTEGCEGRMIVLW